jgi:hypothetical protein
VILSIFPTLNTLNSAFTSSSLVSDSEVAEVDVSERDSLWDSDSEADPELPDLLLLLLDDPEEERDLDCDSEALSDEELDFFADFGTSTGFGVSLGFSALLYMSEI